MRRFRLVWLPVIGSLAAAYLWMARAPAPDVSLTPESAAPAPASGPFPSTAAEPRQTASDPFDDAGDENLASLVESVQVRDASECLDAIETALPDIFGGNRRRMDTSLNSLDLESILGSASSQLGVSMDPEHRIAAAMFEPFVELTDDEFTGLLTPYSGNVLVAWHGLRLCLEHPEGTCPFEDAFADELTLLDSGNSEVWAQVAVSRYRRGDTDGSLAALAQAAAASRTASYWLETTELMERALLASTGLDTGTRVALALGGYDSPRYGLLEAMCRERAQSGNEWAEHCLALGELMEREYRTELGRSMGRSLRLTVFRAEGLPEDDIAEQLGTPEYKDRITYSQDLLFQAMIRTSDTQFHRYLDLAREYGETPGKLRYLEQELEAFLVPIGLGECRSVLLDD